MLASRCPVMHMHAIRLSSPFHARMVPVPAVRCPFLILPVHGYLALLRPTGSSSMHAWHHVASPIRARVCPTFTYCSSPLRSTLSRGLARRPAPGPPNSNGHSRPFFCQPTSIPIQFLHAVPATATTPTRQLQPASDRHGAGSHTSRKFHADRNSYVAALGWRAAIL